MPALRTRPCRGRAANLAGPLACEAREAHARCQRRPASLAACCQPSAVWLLQPCWLPCRYFHCFALVSSVVPLAVGYPERAVLPSAVQLALLLGIACG